MCTCVVYLWVWLQLFRTAYHYACAMKEEEREDFKAQLQDVGCDTQLVDCVSI